MDKKKVLKIGGIALLSIIFLVIPFLVITFVGYRSISTPRMPYEYGGMGVVNSLEMTKSSLSSLSDSLYDLYDSASQINTYDSIKSDSEADMGKSIIKQGELRVLADDIDETIQEIESIAKRYQAESQRTHDSGKGKYRTVTMVYKVKVTDFERFFKDLKNMNVEFDFSSSGIIDVTNEVMDLEARLKTYRNTEEQLLEIQKAATTVPDTMAVFQELDTIRYKIEGIESQLKHYSNQTDYSTVAISIAQNDEGAMIEDNTWRPLGVLKNALRALLVVLKSLGSAIIWLIVFGSPIAAVVLIIRYVVKKRKEQ